MRRIGEREREKKGRLEKEKTKLKESKRNWNTKIKLCYVWIIKKIRQLYRETSRKKNKIDMIIVLFSVSLFNVISTFMGYSMPKASL